jgi:hypothetical protein
MINQHNGDVMQNIQVLEPTATDRKTMAREHSALFPTKLALARWTSGSSQPHLHTGDGLPLRAAWLAQAQRDFQAWLDHGGFTQHDEIQRVDPPAPDGQAHSEDVAVD